MYVHMSKRVNQRWPDGLYERAEAAAACAPTPVTVTDLTVAAVERALDAIEAKGDGLSADGPLPVSAPSKREPKPEASTTDTLAGAVKAGKRAAAEFAAAVDDRCKHPKSRRSRGQCLACFTYLDKP